MKFLWKSVQGNISYCIEGGSSGNAKQFIMYTALKIAEVDGGFYCICQVVLRFGCCIWFCC